MLKSYFKIAYRNLARRKGYAFINVFGLAVGLACCLLIFLFVRDELSYDRFHENADRLYRAWGQEDWGEDQEYFYTVTPIPLGPALEATFPQVEQTVRVDVYEDLVGPEQSRFTERIHVVDSSFFEMFSFPLIEGDPAMVLDEPNSVVLTPEIAERYFGGGDPMGQTLRVNVDGEPYDLVVTGIAEAPPTASSIQFDLLIPFERGLDRYSESALQSWSNIYPETYVLLREGVEATEMEALLPKLSRQVLGKQAEERSHTIGLQPITDIHLNRDFPVGIEPTSDPRYAYILSAIALLVLLIACINFVTLSVGLSAQRAREVGVRKALGASRPALMRQFWGEALLLVGVALLAGLALARGLLPFFNDLAGREFDFSLGGGMLLFLVVLLLLVGLGAGSYPAFVLSGFRPVQVLRGRLQLAGDRGLLRRGLVVVQFAIAILMITSTLLVVQQLRYVQTKNLGFDKEQVVVLRTGVGVSEALPLIERFHHAVSGRPEVTGVAASAYALDEGWAEIGFDAEDGSYREFSLNWITPDFLETMGMELAAGRSFSPDLPTDSSALIVNEAFVRAYGWGRPEAALGRRLPGSGFPPHEIVGVVKDFNYESLRSEVRPLVLAINPNVVLEGASDIVTRASSNRKLAVRIRPEGVPGAVPLLRRTWEEVAPGLPFDYYFLDQAVDSQYRQEERLGRIAGTASALAILIACLGLFGLATLTVARRAKEIGIRKVLGASVAGIAALLSKDFAKLILVAFALAAPVAYLAMRRWLADFAYRIEPGPGVFLLAGGAALLVALLTVSYQAVKAALTDPVESLRYE